MSILTSRAPALGESRRQQLLPLPLSTAPAPDPTGQSLRQAESPAPGSLDRPGSLDVRVAPASRVLENLSNPRIGKYIPDLVGEELPD